MTQINMDMTHNLTFFLFCVLALQFDDRTLQNLVLLEMEELLQDKSKVQKTSPKDRKSEQSENGKRMGMGKEEMEKPEQDTWREGQNNGKGKRKKK